MAKTSNKSNDNSSKTKEEYKEEKKGWEWKDLNENSKYVCERGIIKCPYCSVTDAQIKVTSNDILLQDTPWLTTGDSDGKVNFMFKGLCTKAPGTNKPPCLSVINLLGWENPSKTFIQDYNALRMDSFIKCGMSGDKLTFTDCGQRSEPGDPQEVLTDGGVYFVDGKWVRDDNGKFPIKHAMNNSTVRFIVEMKNTDNISDKVIEVHFYDANDRDNKRKTVKRGTNTAQKFWDIVDDKVLLKLNLVGFKQTSKLFAICRVKGGDGKLEEVRLPRSEEEYLTIHSSICVDKYKMPGLNKEGTDIANDMCFGSGIGRKSASIYSSFDCNIYRQEYRESGFDIEKHGYYANRPDTSHINHILSEIAKTSSDEQNDHTVARRDNIPDIKPLPGPEMKMRYLIEDIKSAEFTEKLPLIDVALPFPINTGKDIVEFKEWVELFTLGNRKLAEEYLFSHFKLLVSTLFDWGELSGNITQMIDKFKVNTGGIYETQQLSDNLAKNPATDGYCGKVNSYISHMLKQSDGDISALIDDYVYFANKVDSEIRMGAKKNFGSISYTWKISKEGIKNVIEGRTIALNDIWAREIHLQSFDWIDENRYKLSYKIILWDHFGLDKNDLEKIFNVLPVSWEVFACWFLLQHCYNYRPFITKAEFVKEFEGDVRISALDEKGKKEAAKEEEERSRKERVIVEEILNGRGLWDLKW